jgi:hypothetical protein
MDHALRHLDVTNVGWWAGSRREGCARRAGGRAEGTAEVDWRWAGGVRGERARGREGSQSSWAPSWDKLVSEGYANASKQNGHEVICFIVSDWLFKKLMFWDKGNAFISFVIVTLADIGKSKVQNLY